MNPTVYFSSSLNTSNIQGLLIAIKENTGLLYGFMPQEMTDTQFISVILTLCKVKKLSKLNQKIVDSTIRAWAIGYGLGCPRIVWPNCY